MVKKKGDVRHSDETKNLMISLINDYKLFNATDAEMMRLISQKLGKPISYTLFGQLKKEATKRESISSEWLDTFCKKGIIDHYWTLIKGLNFGHRVALELIAKEMAKEKPNGFLVNQLLKTLGDLSTRLSEMGMSPPMVAKLYSLIPEQILNGSLSNNPIELEKYLKMFDDNMKEDREKAIPKLVDSNIESDKKDEQHNEGTAASESTNGGNDEINPLYTETAIPPPIDKKSNNGPDGGTPSETATAQGDQPVF